MSDLHAIDIRPADLHALGTPIVPETLAGPNAHGIQETLELIDFLFLAPEKLIGALKDGMQLRDVSVLIDREVIASARDAFSGSRHIASEVADLTLDEYEALVDVTFRALVGREFAVSTNNPKYVLPQGARNVFRGRLSDLIPAVQTNTWDDGCFGDLSLIL